MHDIVSILSPTPMLRAAHVLKAGGRDDWPSFAATGSASLRDQSL